MKRLILLLLFTSFIFPLFSAVFPMDADIGKVSSGTDGVEALFVEAFHEPFSLEWCEKYVSADSVKDFAFFHSASLSSLLPMESFIISEKQSDRLYIKDTLSGALITLYLDDGNLITAIGIRE